MRKFWLFLFMASMILVAVRCGKQEKGPTEKGKSNEELIKERFATYKDGFKNKDINAIMTVIANTYYDQFNHSKEDYRNWLQAALSGWTWNSIEMEIAGTIEIVPGRQWLRGSTNATASHPEETRIRATNSSQDLLMSSKSDLTFGWEMIERSWDITKIYGTVGRVVTQPASVTAGSEVTVSVFTLPEGAPPTAYDTKAATVSGWNGEAITVQDQGNHQYIGTFMAPAPGTYTLTATVSDSTWNKTITLQHTFTVQ